jgi:hypothetical protein
LNPDKVVKVDKLKNTLKSETWKLLDASNVSGRANRLETKAFPTR